MIVPSEIDELMKYGKIVFILQKTEENLGSGNDCRYDQTIDFPLLSDDFKPEPEKLLENIQHIARSLTWAEGFTDEQNPEYQQEVTA